MSDFRVNFVARNEVETPQVAGNCATEQASWERAFSLGPWPDRSLGTLRGDHLDRRHLHRVSLILSGDSDASDFDLMAEVRSEVRGRLRNHDFFRPFLQIGELEGSGIISLRQTPCHAVLCGRTLGLGANSETKYARNKRRQDNESFHLTP